MLDELGNQYQMNHQFEEARASYQESLKELETLLSLDETALPVRENAAFAHSRLGDIAFLKGDHAAARSAYSAAIATMAPILKLAELSRRSLRLASRCHERLSWALAGLQETAQADLELQAALNFNQQLLKIDAADHKSSLIVAICCTRSPTCSGVSPI